MSVASSSSAKHSSADDHESTDDASILEMLPSDLRCALEVQARDDHQSILALLTRLILIGAAAEGLSPAGRCSTRMGRCYEGPQMLALQQGQPVVDEASTI